MDVIKDFYPVGIGKHIVCIDAGKSAAYKQLIGVNPEPHTFFYEKKGYAKRNEIIKSEMSNILRKVRTKPRQTTKQK